MPRPFIGSANIFPPLGCERLEDRSVLSASGLDALVAAEEFAATIPGGEIPNEVIVSDEGIVEWQQDENVNDDETWFAEEEFFDESWVPEEEFYDETWFEEEFFDESWVPEEEYYDETWFEEEFFDESWVPEESEWDDWYLEDGSGLIDRSGGEFDDELLYLTTMVTGGIPVMLSSEIAESAVPSATPDLVVVNAVPGISLSLPPEIAPAKSIAIPEVTAPLTESDVPPMSSAPITPDHSADASTGLTLGAAAAPDDHLSDAESLALSEDLPVG